MKIICHRCGKKWNYEGEKIEKIGTYPQYITCPECRTSVKLKKIDEDENNTS